MIKGNYQYLSENMVNARPFGTKRH